MSDSAHAIPVLVVTGFLGSGKTTLIRSLLADPRAADTALIVNEFGETGIDHHLLRHTDERSTLLRGGCVCCSLRDDLSEATRDLLARRDDGTIAPFDRIIIETTGLADPGPILHTLVSDPVLRHRCRMDRSLVTLDAVAGLSNLQTYGEALRQVAAADLVAITKLDIAPHGRFDELRAAVARINPSAVIIATEHGRFDAGMVLDALDERATSFPGRVTDVESLPVQHAIAGRVSAHTLVFEEQIDWRMFGVWLTLLLHRHGEQVLRMKGLLKVGEERGPLLLEGVQHVMHAPRHLAAWPDDDRRSRLVFIVRELDIAAIRQSLATFLAIS